VLDEEMRKALEAIVEALEYFWLEKTAATYLLEKHRIPRWFDLIQEYCQRPESKAQAQKRFATARALLQQAQSDSEALEALAEALGKKQKAS
jgi:DNA repair exonuclease SbcCD ATPase subunit